ncbi:hypothetical protein BC628DRAFT_1415836 [Trametes gibbosa]|nr:hypothetical protein BC628DRAFT_1415836 [Trametes gibbosa]
MIDLEDGTTGGRIIAKRWLNNLDKNWLSTDGEQYYARIVGRLIRGQQETRNTLEVKAFRRVGDPHEMFHHVLQAAFVTLSLARGPPSKAAWHSVCRSFEPEDGGQDERFAPPSAPNTPAAPRVASLGRTKTPSTMQNMPTSNPAAPPLPETLSASASRITLPQTPPSHMLHTHAASHRCIPSPTPPPASPPPSPVRASSATAHQNPASLGARRVPGLKRDPLAHLGVLERAILLKILSSDASADSKEGVSCRTIVRAVAHYNATQDEIGKALDVLVDENFIIEIDDGHYTAAMNHYPASS